MEDRQPIIVKRVKKGGGHHGGSWKVALADFTTAMMAFFMVLWLTATTNPKEKAAIQAYFKDPVGFVSGGSPNPIDLKGSASVAQQSSADQATHKIQIPQAQVKQMADTLERQKLKQLMATIKQKIDSDKTLQKFKNQLLIDMTDQGLRIQIVDSSGRPMFDSGSAQLKYYSEDLLFALAKPLSKLDNKISITGHTDSTPFEGRPGYTNWELSADRANTARRALVAGGVQDGQIARVVGLADSVPLDPNDPKAAINRRISIIVLNKKAEQTIKKNAGSSLQLDLKKPTPEQTKKAMKSLEQGTWFDNANGGKKTSSSVQW